ncbi:MAG: hypothetical protein ACLFPR_02385, partial [Desulfococcaceae bacterium]
MGQTETRRGETGERPGRRASLFLFFFAASLMSWLALSSGRGLASVPGALTILAGTFAGARVYRRDT